MQKAAALAYEKTKDSAPQVVASGKGFIAQKIIAKAQEFDIPLFCNKALVDSLVDLEIQSHIPQELYHGVVEVFVWLEKVERSAQLSEQS